MPDPKEKDPKTKDQTEQEALKPTGSEKFVPPDERRMSLIRTEMRDVWRHYDCNRPVKLPKPINVRVIRNGKEKIIPRTHGYFVRADLENNLVVVSIRDDSRAARLYFPDQVIRDPDWKDPEIEAQKRSDIILKNESTQELLPQHLSDLRAHYHGETARRKVAGSAGAALAPRPER